MPHTFLDGTSAQCPGWFATGSDSGDLRALETFAVERS